MRLDVDVDAADGRYHRQELISWWDQTRLARARVLVIGAGALGNELLKNLALLGVGHIVVVDMDRIENSNLSRCVLFCADDEGQPKAEVAAAAAGQLNPDVEVVPVVGDVRIDLGLGVFADADLVLGGLDNREARLHINRACWKVNRPWIDGAIEGLMGTMRLFLPPDSACYECTMTERDHELVAFRKSCTLLSREQMLAGKVPTTATSASIIAALQVQEAVKLLHRDKIEPTMAGRGFAFNGLTHDSYVVSYPRRDDCMSHDTYGAANCVDTEPDPRFGELLKLAADRIESPVLDLEHEVVIALECAACGPRETLWQPVERVTADAARCPTCDGERRPILTHVITSADADLLEARPSDLGLPPFDIVTARAGELRLHFRLGGGVNAFDAVMQR